VSWSQFDPGKTKTPNFIVTFKVSRLNLQVRTPLEIGASVLATDFIPPPLAPPEKYFAPFASRAKLPTPCSLFPLNPRILLSSEQAELEKPHG
jgi:hypothetical protein